MINKEYKNEFGDHIIFEFPDELLSKYERWAYLNTATGDESNYYEWSDIDAELKPYMTDLNP